MDKLVSVVIVNWNGEKFLRKCINSFLQQTYSNIEIIVIDNDSTDNSVSIIKEFSKKNVKLIENKNIGYAGGANTGIDISNGQYVMIANPDIILKDNYIELCIEKFNEDEKIASVIGKLLKYDFDEDKILDVIDSAGISLSHKRHGIDIGQNDLDVGQFEKDRRIFGACGAAVIYRKEALEAIKIDNEYFDSDFFAYKEDIDIAWRLNLYGYINYYIHNAIVYHGRGMNSSSGILETIRNRKNQSEFLKGISFRNQYLMLIKNENTNTYKRDKFGIWIEFLKYIIFFMFFDRGCLKYLKEIKRLKPLMIKKRNIIMQNVKLSDSEIYKLFDL